MDVKEIVKEKYGEAALKVISGAGGGCCSDSASCCSSADPITTQSLQRAAEG